jgi:hypothetical protein
MKVYAVRQKSTGLFIPKLEVGKRRGGSYLEPSDVRPPRIFHSAAAAKAFLSNWLQGHFKNSYYQDETGSELCIEVVKQPHRKKEDMEIVEFQCFESVFFKIGSETSFQNRVKPWMMEAFSMEICRDIQERCHRFIEESLELVQACGTDRSEVQQLVEYVYGRPVGEKIQEIGGVMVTLAALCLAEDLNMHEAGEIELARIWNYIDKIRAKQAAKPKHSPLPA